MPRTIGRSLCGILLFLTCGTGGWGCSSSSGPSPFRASDGGNDVGADVEAGALVEGGSNAPLELGPPCSEDVQCDDGVPCTRDSCDLSHRRCRFTPDDAPCQDATYCNGAERCDPHQGCAPGSPVTCEDGNACTIDRCLEGTRSCEHLPRDADGDLDPDVHCGTGKDCDDTDPLVSSTQSEVCANGKDDNCDGIVDEDPCKSPSHDRCTSPLTIAATGAYELSTIAAHADYAGTCSPVDPQVRDVVAAVEVRETSDVEITVQGEAPELALALFTTCGVATSELACHRAPEGTAPARVRIRARQLAPGAYPLVVWSTREQPISVEVAYLAPSVVPTNETCASAAPLLPGVQTEVDLVDAVRDLGSLCVASSGELVYAFSLDMPRNVTLHATAEDDDALTSLSLRDSGCAGPADELSCVTDKSAELLRKDLAPGTYYVAVSTSRPGLVRLELTLSGATPPGADESCTSPPELPPNVSLDVALAGHQDNVRDTCLVGAKDAVYELDLAVPSDVLFVQRISNADVGSISLGRFPCATASDFLGCQFGSMSPVRSAYRNVAAGSYRVVVESKEGNPVQVTALVRATQPPVLVPFADNCSEAMAIPSGGGLFVGNTGSATADYSAGCDTSVTSPGGGADQVLRLDLASQKRVIFDMSGSRYSTLLDVRQGDRCPGTEVVAGCSVGTAVHPSYLDKVLGAGTYWLQVDGFAEDHGEWALDVHVIDP